MRNALMNGSLPRLSRDSATACRGLAAIRPAACSGLAAMRPVFAKLDHGQALGAGCEQRCALPLVSGILKEPFDCVMVL